MKIIYTKYEANPIIKTFTPIELTPPNPKSKACKISAKDIENIATLPKNTPINPKSMRWICVGPNGIWINEATKKRALNADAKTIFSLFKLLKE